MTKGPKEDAIVGQNVERGAHKYFYYVLISGYLINQASVDHI